MSASSAAKRVNPALDVVVLEKSPYISYSTCSIPYYVSNDIKDHRDLLEMTPEVARKERGIVVQTGREAVAIDVKAKTLIVEEAAGRTRQPVSFDRLVIATGAAPIKPRLPGIDLRNIFTIRTLEDGLSVRQFIDSRGPDPSYDLSGERPGDGKNARQRIAQLNAVIVGGGARAYPLGKRIFVTYVVERGSGKLLGAQMVGEEGIAHRIDTLAACLYGRMTIEDVSRLDLGYAPPFATVWDPIVIAANVALKELRKKA